MITDKFVEENLFGWLQMGSKGDEKKDDIKQGLIELSDQNLEFKAKNYFDDKGYR